MPPAPTRRRPSGRFRARLTAITALLVMVPVVVVGWILIRINETALETAWKERIYAVTDDIANTITNSLRHARDGLDDIGHVLDTQSISPRDRVALIQAMVAARPEGASLAIFDDAGARFEVIRRPDDRMEFPPRLPEALAQATSEWTLGEILATGDAPVIQAVRSVKVGDGRWTLMTHISLEAISERITDLSTYWLDREFDALYVIDAKQRIVAHSDPEQSAALAPATSLPPSGLVGEVTQRTSIFAEVDSQRGRMLSALVTIPQVPLRIVAAVPLAKIYAPVRRHKIILGIVAGGLLLLGVVAAWLLARRFSAPVTKLVGLAEALANRKFDHKVDIHTGDELEVLAEAMQSAGHKLATSEQQLRDEASIRSDLGRYLPAALVDKVVRREQDLQLGGARRTVTVLFADVTSFSSLAEQQPPEVVVTILNQLFTILTEVIFRHGGTVDKFIGDSVMALWNVPDDQPDHVVRAVQSATDMLRWLEVGNQGWQQKYGVTIHLAIGVHTGEAVVGNFGSETRMEYTCVGDTVNIAARLESLARPQQILVSRDVEQAVRHQFDLMPLGTHRLPGRLEPLELFEVAGD